MLVNERLYLTADKKTVVKHGDGRAAFLLAAPGQTIPDKVAAKYGLLDENKPEQKQVDQPENKAAKGRPKKDKEEK